MLADTAGRLHTKTNLMEELRKVRRVADQEPGKVTEVLLVLDATTGQNGLVQAQQFTEAVDVTGVVLTKLDGSAKGGIVLAIQSELGIPVKLVGLGETADDLVDFDAARVRRRPLRRLSCTTSIPRDRSPWRSERSADARLVRIGSCRSRVGASKASGRGQVGYRRAAWSGYRAAGSCSASVGRPSAC